MITRLLGAALAAALLAPAAGSASDLLGDINTSATFAANITAINGAAIPWTGEVFSEPFQCLRIAVTAQSTDLLMTAIGPDGTVYRDDNSGGSNKPLIRISPTPDHQGYWSVQVTQRAGQAVNATFTLNLQRLPAFTASCLPATIPMKGGT